MSERQQIDELAIALFGGGLRSEEAWTHAAYEVDHADSNEQACLPKGDATLGLYFVAMIIGIAFTVLVAMLS